MNSNDKYIIVKHHMLGSLFLGMGGSEYTALETVIGLARHGYNVCFKPLIPVKKIVDPIFIHKYYGIPLNELRHVNICRRNIDELLTINMSGDLLSGSSDIIYFHFPVFSKPETYYPILGSRDKLFAYLYYYYNIFTRKLFIRKTKVFIANSSFTSRYIYEAIDVKPVIIYPPVNLDDIYVEEPYSLEDRENNILVVSRISYEKQPHRVLWIAKALKELELHDWKVLMVGSRSRYSDEIVNEIMEYAGKMGVEKYILFKQGVERIELVNLYRTAYLYIHLTSKEHFGISIVEAMGSGTPVIVPYTSSAWRDVLLEDRKYGLPYRCYRELLHSINRLIKNKEQWISISRNGRERAKYFSRKRYHLEISKLTGLLIKKLQY